MVRLAWLPVAALAGAFAFPSASVAQSNSTTVDYLVVSPDSACVRISGGGLPEQSERFEAIGWNRGPNAVAENQGGDDIELGPVPVVWAMPDSIFDAHSGQRALTESPNGMYGNLWNVSATIGTSFDLSSASSASLDFWYHHDLESGFDYGRVEVDNGSGWTVVATFNGTVGAPDSFLPASIDLASYLGQTIDIRFRVHTDGSVVRDGWVIDDVVVRADAADLFTDDFESGLAGWTISAEWGLTLPSAINVLGTVTPDGKFVAGGLTGTTVIRAIHGGTTEATARVDIYPPSWVQ